MTKRANLKLFVFLLTTYELGPRIQNFFKVYGIYTIQPVQIFACVNLHFIVTVQWNSIAAQFGHFIFTATIINEIKIAQKKQLSIFCFLWNNLQSSNCKWLVKKPNSLELETILTNTSPLMFVFTFPSSFLNKDRLKLTTININILFTQVATENKKKIENSFRSMVNSKFYAFLKQFVGFLIQDVYYACVSVLRKSSSISVFLEVICIVT